MDIDVARHVVRGVLRSAQELQQLIHLLKDHCETEEYETYVRGIGTAIHTMHVEVMERAFAAHPGLEQEVDAMMAKYERYL
jgi:hypothetical protein